jgi:hypothetical protein
MCPVEPEIDLDFEPPSTGLFLPLPGAKPWETLLEVEGSRDGPTENIRRRLLKFGRIEGAGNTCLKEE